MGQNRIVCLLDRSLALTGNAGDPGRIAMTDWRSGPARIIGFGAARATVSSG